MTMADLHWHEFSSSDALAETLAGTVREALGDAVRRNGRAVIAVSGGRTPAAFFSQLSRQKLAWDKVTVTLVDERFVPTKSPRSNARLVARHLLQNEAASAEFVGLYSDSTSVEEAAERAAQAFTALPEPLDVVVLGMGGDMHTASFFPDANDIEALLEAKDGPAVLPVQAPSAGEPRLTLSLKRLSEARFLALHIEGGDKKETLETALTMPLGPEAPIRAVLEAAATPAHIYWAPAS